MPEERKHLRRSSLDEQSEGPDTLKEARVPDVQVEMLVRKREMQSDAQERTGWDVEFTHVGGN